MSLDLYWRPVQSTKHCLPRALKYVLQGKRMESGDVLVMGEDDAIYLSGLRDAEVEGAQELIDAIGRHGAIEVWIGE